MLWKLAIKAIHEIKEMLNQQLMCLYTSSSVNLPLGSHHTTDLSVQTHNVYVKGTNIALHFLLSMCNFS
jgi:hypothetical protein